MDQGKKTLLLLLAVFLVPVILGAGMYFAMDKIELNPGQANYGILVVPAKPLQVMDLRKNGEAVNIQEVLHKKWTMVFLAGKECDQSCKDRLLLMKNVRLLINEHMRRIRTVMVGQSAGFEAALKKDYPDMVFTQVSADNSAFEKQFPNQGGSPIYLIDPLGNLMMFYPEPKPNAKLMIKDLKRLLKYSHVG